MEVRDTRTGPASLCLSCAAMRRIVGRRSAFVLCTVRAEKYPPQPVLRCPDFRETPRAHEAQDEPRR